MKFRTMSVAVVAGFALVAGCSSSADYEAASAPKKNAAPAEVPRWIRDGVRIAKATKAARSAKNGSASSANAPLVIPSTAKADQLPSREVVVGALTGAGLTATQASCMYDAIAASPQTATDVTAIIKGLAGATAAPAGATGFDPASIPALASLTPESTTRLLMALGPCLDQATLLGLLAAGQGLGATGGDSGGIAALLSQAQGLDLTKLANFDPNAIAAAAAGALGSEQVAQLAQLLGAVGTAQAALPGLLANPLLTLDLSKLDLSKLTPEQMPLLVLALIRGLTGDQQGQLMKLAQVNLDQLNINIDPDKLSPDEIGTLLLILAPLLAGAIKPNPTQAPDGSDPNQIYIPPGADLSNINPLTFLNRDDVIAQFQKQGINVAVAGCIFDGLARLAPSTIAAFFSADAGPAAAGAVLLTAVSCLAQNS